MRRKIVYTCPFVPAEWIEAHGFRPSRVAPSRYQKAVYQGACAYASAFADLVETSDADACILSTICDQMRRMYDTIPQSVDKPVFLMNIPHTWETAGSQRMYLDEVLRLGRFMERLGGHHPTDEQLADVMRRYDTDRSRLRVMRGSVSPRRYSEMIRDFNANPSISGNAPETAPGLGGVPIALIGGPLMDAHMDIFDLVEKHGGYIALDASETGERGIPAPFDRRRLADEPLDVLVDTYFKSISDAARRPNSLLYQWLSREIESRGIRALIFVRYVWCDIWHAEAQRMKEWFGFPMLDLDITGESNDLARNTTRIQAFMEMLR
ncbi:MAG: 2-hydroxyacyl-CoA dehydratase [Armatimonadota bacterium]